MNECSSMEEMQCGYLAALNFNFISSQGGWGLKVHYLVTSGAETHV